MMVFMLRVVAKGTFPENGSGPFVYSFYGGEPLPGGLAGKWFASKRVSKGSMTLLRGGGAAPLHSSYSASREEAKAWSTRASTVVVPAHMTVSAPPQ